MKSGWRNAVAMLTGCLVAVVAASVMAQTPAAEKPFSDDFRGHVTYHGSYHGAVTQNPDRSSFKNGTLSVTIGGGKKTKINGDIDIDLRIDGANVTLTSRATGPFSTEIEVGTRQGANCVFPESNGAIIAYCGQDGFRGQFKTNKGEDPKVEVDIDTVTTAIVDAVEEERQRAAAEAQRQKDLAAAQAEAERKKAEYAAWLKSLKPAGVVMTAMLKTAVETDATNWVFNRYDAGSLTDVRVMETAADGTITLLAKYTFNGGGEGWVKGRVKSGQVTCLEYWDSRGVCSAPRARAPQVSGYPDVLDLTGMKFETYDAANLQCFSSFTEDFDNDSQTYVRPNGSVAKSTYSRSWRTYVRNDCAEDKVFVVDNVGLFSSGAVTLKPGGYLIYKCERTDTYTDNRYDDPFGTGRRTVSCWIGRTYTSAQVVNAGKR